jgi:CRP-like cAMP-binding protein
MVTPSLLRRFVPLASLPPGDLNEITRSARMGNYQPGQVIFNRGDTAKSAVYLVSGDVELVSEAGTHVIAADTGEARNALSRSPRRAATATCVATAQVLFVDRERLDLALTWSQTGGVEVVELREGDEEGGDWMTSMLQSQAFHRIPPGNIAQIFAAMKPVEHKAGETILREGEPGDYYYVVTHGLCRVTQRDEAGGEQEVAQVGVGDGFGEEALVSGSPRNATVSAATDCALMRLAATDFARLLKAPLLRELGPDEIPADAVLVDVRLAEEWKNGRLPDSVNLPLVHLREMAVDLDPQRCYVVYCDTGRRSASATYLLCERGFDARLLTGGIPADEMPVRG